MLEDKKYKEAVGLVHEKDEDMLIDDRENFALFFLIKETMLNIL